MKKIVLSSLLLAGASLMGCSRPSKETVINDSVNPTIITEEQAPVEKAPVVTNTNILDEEKIREIVNNEVNGTIVSLHKDYDDARSVYDVTVIDETYKYEFEIDATTGHILSQDKELINQVPNSTNIPGENNTPEINIDEAQVREIALNLVPNGMITELSLDYEKGTLVYDITVVEGTTKYEFEISGIDGQIISRSMESIFD